MVTRRPNSKDTVSDRNSNICISLIFEKIFCESPVLKNFAGINIRESTFSGIKKGIYFREFSKNSRNFLPAKISSHKVPKWLVEYMRLERPRRNFVKKGEVKKMI